MVKKPASTIIVTIIVIILAVAVINEFARQSQPLQKGNNATAAAAVQYTTVTLFPQNAGPLQIKAEVADTAEARTTGLMFRKSLGENGGMLFVFPAVSVQYFWMKNTLISLDMIFIAENMTIVKIHRAVPCKQAQCQVYSSEKPVKYVLEVDGNTAINRLIEEGSKVVIER